MWLIKFRVKAYDAVNLPRKFILKLRLLLMREACWQEHRSAQQLIVHGYYPLNFRLDERGTILNPEFVMFNIVCQSSVLEKAVV